MVYATTGNPPSGNTEHVCLSEPSIQNWINQNSEAFEPSFMACECREKRLHPMKKPFVLLPSCPFVYEGNDLPYQGGAGVYDGDALVFQGDDGTTTFVFCDALGD